MHDIPRAMIAALLLIVAVARAPDASAQKLPRRVNTFLSYDQSAHAVRLSLVASSDTSNNSLNYNGRSEGHLEVEVPLGWTVRVHLMNAGELQHSALVIGKEEEPPIVPEHPVFRGGSIHPSDIGLVRTARDSMSFVASKVGTYALVCGVPAHAQLGMWIRFTVSARARIPRYLVTSATAAALRK